jgi:hypothetical protein
LTKWIESGERRWNDGMSDEPKKPYRKRFSFSNLIARLILYGATLLFAQRIVSGETEAWVHIGGCLPVRCHVINGKPVSPWVERYIFWNGY